MTKHIRGTGVRSERDGLMKLVLYFSRLLSLLQDNKKRNFIKQQIVTEMDLNG